MLTNSLGTKEIRAATITIDNVTVSTRGAVQFKVTMPTFVTVTENGVTDFECGSLQTITPRERWHIHAGLRGGRADSPSDAPPDERGSAERPVRAHRCSAPVCANRRCFISL